MPRQYLQSLANIKDQDHSEGMMYWHDGYGYMAGFFMIAFWLLIVGVGVFVARWLMRSSKQGSDSASAILDERLARGEISVAEYHERKAALRQQKQ